MSCRLIRGDFECDISKPLQRHGLAGERTMAYREAVEKCTFKISLVVIVVGASDGGVWIHLHVFEALMHEVIIEVLLVELFKRRLRRTASVSSVSAVERIECHNHVYKHECSADDGKRIAKLPWNFVDEFYKWLHQKFDPDKPNDSSNNKEANANTSIDVKR